MKCDWKRIEAAKRALRKRLVALPYGEKLRLLDRMRERDILLKGLPSFSQR